MICEDKDYNLNLKTTESSQKNRNHDEGLEKDELSSF